MTLGGLKREKEKTINNEQFTNNGYNLKPIFDCVNNEKTNAKEPNKVAGTTHGIFDKLFFNKAIRKNNKANKMSAKNRGGRYCKP